MRNLAIECSGLSTGVALSDGGHPLVVRNLPANLSSVRSLAATLEDLCAESDIRHNLPQFISVSIGPGSFTSLRVGLATAKMLAMAWDIPLAGVDTLQVIAHQIEVHSPADASPIRYVVPLLNAFRRQVFVAAWRFEAASDPVCVVASTVVDAADWIERPLDALQQKSVQLRSRLANDPIDPPPQWVVAGPGLKDYPPKNWTHLQAANADCWLPRVETVARLGWKQFVDGQVCSAIDLLPKYVRASAAEEKVHEHVERP